MEYDKKAISFFHKAHLYWDVWKYFILHVRLLITLELMTKQYNRYEFIGNNCSYICKLELDMIITMDDNTDEGRNNEPG